MPKKKPVKLNKRARNKRERVETQNKPVAQKTDSLLTQSTTRKRGKVSVKTTKSMSGEEYKLTNDFTRFALEESTLKDDLKQLWNTLRSWRISPKKFFQLMGLGEFLKPGSGYKPGGRINEILILFNKRFVDFLIAQFSEKSFNNLLELRAEGRKNPKIATDWKILNSENKGLSNLEIDEFKKIDTELCYDFKTGANPKIEPKILYLDGALAKFDPRSGKLLIIDVLQLKSPSNVGDLATQLAETLKRLQKSTFISFQKDGKLHKVPSENVYVLAGESLGIFYGDIKRSFDLIDLTSDAGDVLKSADMRPKFTASGAPEFFVRLRVQYKDPKVTPNTIEKMFEKIRADFLKKSKIRQK